MHVSPPDQFDGLALAGQGPPSSVRLHPHRRASTLPGRSVCSHGWTSPAAEGLLMCGIVGLFLKTNALQPELGRLTAAMVSQLADRGPDSAGFAVYCEESSGITKICAVLRERRLAWPHIANQLSEA